VISVEAENFCLLFQGFVISINDDIFIGSISLLTL